MKEKTLKSRVEYLEELVRKIRNEEDSLDFSFEDPEIEDEDNYEFEAVKRRRRRRSRKNRFYIRRI